LTIRRNDDGMQLDLSLMLALGLVTAAAHWLIARSSIARPFWSRTRGVFAALLRCAGCSGWWLGLGAGAAGLRPLDTAWGVIADTGATGLFAIVLTPVFEAVLLWGLDVTAIPNEDEQRTPPQQ
jgi:integral membrane sensor domain MASE1